MTNKERELAAVAAGRKYWIEIAEGEDFEYCEGEPCWYVMERFDERPDGWYNVDAIWSYSGKGGNGPLDFETEADAQAVADKMNAGWRGE